MNRRGFTLLEVLIATLIMGIAVTALVSNLSVSLRTAAKLTDNDRAALVARAKMDELLLMAKLPHGQAVEGAFDPRAVGWKESGWRAMVSVFEAPPGAGAMTPVVERIDLEVWWSASFGRRTFRLDAYRRGFMQPVDVGAIP